MVLPSNRRKCSLRLFWHDGIDKHGENPNTSHKGSPILPHWAHTPLSLQDTPTHWRVNIWHSLLHPLSMAENSPRVRPTSLSPAISLLQFQFEFHFEFQFWFRLFRLAIAGFFLPLFLVCVRVWKIRVCNVMFLCLISFSWIGRGWCSEVGERKIHAYCWNYVARCTKGGWDGVGRPGESARRRGGLMFKKRFRTVVQKLASKKG